MANNSIIQTSAEVKGEYVKIGKEEFYKISNYDSMRPFFISLVSHSDHWLFISTTGGLTAGRRNSESAVFPYYTDDKLADASETVGSKSIFRVAKDDKQYLWEPFSNRYQGVYAINRNLYKNFAGNKIIFEEANTDLGLTFQYSWQFSEQYGVVKKSAIQNNGSDDVSIDYLDGIQNIVPYGVTSDLQNAYSNLTNAYKKCELDTGSGLGMFMLSAIIVDKAEPSEALKTTTVWNAGITPEKILLSSRQVNDFRLGRTLKGEEDVRAESGSYFVNGTIQVKKNDTLSWFIVAEVNQDHSKVVALINSLSNKKKLHDALLADIESGTSALLRLVGKSDGLQQSADKLSVSRHYANVLFNIMRGGIFDEDYHVEKSDLIDYVKSINKVLFELRSDFFNQFSEQFSYQELIQAAHKTKDADIIRISYEYLPLTFSRRHGDPSRPWNKFSIITKNEDGSKKRSYQGNWRDIFQNWEALSVSFPDYILSMITKFVNASTIDGYNPYRITRNGIDWEVIEPDDPWSYIGYWGDHQIIYLQKLLEVAVAHQNEDLLHLLNQSIYVYANVPYRIKSYADIVKNPKDTIDYSHNEESAVTKRVNKLGADGKLVFDQSEVPTRANLTEKLLVPLLAKLSNFIPEGGIWLNTQRPEWNDANNALVGNGVSMVTLYYMRRYVSFCLSLFGQTKEVTYDLNTPVSDFLKGIFDVFASNKKMLHNAISDVDRKGVVDALGNLGEAYRTRAYKGFDGSKVEVSSSELCEFLTITLTFLDHSIFAAKRKDGLYHAYNLIEFDGNSAKVDHLYEMLEGQVAVLSSGLLSLEESLSLLDALKRSKIYREDQYSYMLYPNRELPRFLEKNHIPQAFAEASGLAKVLLAKGDTSLILRDVNGSFHFNGTFNNAASLIQALEKLKNSELKSLVEQEYESYLQVFEEMFNHRAFTGRSGTFYGYEGLGSIYWHMVSKLLLAVQENINAGWEKYQGTDIMGRMVDHYYEIRAGIGMNKSPELYGSFPTDPYSHSPGNKGVQQPGMTGQVKEDVLNRWAELGVEVKGSRIHFEPKFLSKAELLNASAVFLYYDLDGSEKEIDLAAGELAFTYCQVPVIYTASNEITVQVIFRNGRDQMLDGKALDTKTSKSIFSRTGEIERVRVYQPLG